MIWIFGDSFAASRDPSSWTMQLGDVRNCASNGSSEYRIYKTYLKQRHEITVDDTVIFVHTSPSRIFLKNDRITSSRLLESHPTCDIIINDIYEKREKEFINLLESVWDEDFFEDIFDLMIDKLKVPNSYHITFFESPKMEIVNLNHIWVANPGTVNHMTAEGNRLVVDIVKQLIH